MSASSVKSAEINKDELKMKQTLIALALMLTFSATTVDAQPKHRHHATATAVVQQPDITGQGIEAYSDTTEVTADDTVITAKPTSTSYDPSDYNDPFSWLVAISGTTFGLSLAMIILFFVFAFILLPFILLIVLIRYFIKRHNDRVDLAQRAMASGQPIPEELKPVDKQSDDYLWRKGIKNATLGAGLMVMFWIWSNNGLAGIGALILCYGIGQMVIASTNGPRRH